MNVQRTVATLLTGLAVLPLAAPLSAAGYIKLGDIKGESELASTGVEPDEIDARAAARDEGEGGWMQLTELRFAPDDGASEAAARRQYQPIVIRKRIDASTAEEGEAAATKLPKSSAGNITLKRGVADTADQADAKPVVTYGPVITIKPKGDHTGGPNDIRQAEDDEATALLLPAVQKVREAAARRNAGQPCTLGPVKGPVVMRDDETGGTRKILDAQVIACGRETVTITFSHIAWE